MNNDDTTTTTPSSTTSIWPRKLNKWLVRTGALAVALIVTDRIVDMFSADKVPEKVEIVRESAHSRITVSQNVDVESQAQASADTPGDVLDLDSTFGSRLVFVSATDPSYVLTEDDRRIEIGDNIDDNTTLAAITDERVVLERAGELMLIKLPDPASEPH